MLGDIFSAFDLFKTPFNLKFNRRKEISSAIGGLLSIGIIAVLTFYASQSDIFFQLSPRVVDSTIGLDFRPLVHFKKAKIISVQDDVTLAGIVDPSYFTLQVVSYFYDMKNGSNFEVKQRKLHLCSELDFPENSTVFTALGLTNSFCFEENEFNLEGYWDETTMKYGSFHLMLCDNSTFNGTCKTYEEMKKFLNGKIFNLYFYDSIIDASNYKSPLKNVMVNEWTYIDITARKQREYIFQNIKTTTDDGFLFNNFNFLNDVQFSSKNADHNNVDETDVATPRITFSFVSEKKERTISRIYEKVSDLLAKLGGILNIFLFLGLIWARFEHDFLIKRSILNTLYTFKIISRKHKKKKKSHFLHKLRTTEVKTERKSSADLILSKI